MLNTALPKIARLGRENKFAWIGGGSDLTSTAHVQNVCHGLVLAAGAVGSAHYCFPEMAKRATPIQLAASRRPVFGAQPRPA